MRPRWFALGLAATLATGPTRTQSAPEPAYTFTEAQKSLRTYCLGCHQGKSPAGGFNLTKLTTEASLNTDPHLWNHLAQRVADHTMPPQNVPGPPAAVREKLTRFVQDSLHAAACADGIAPANTLMRRLTRTEYANTVRDLLNIHFNAARGLPADGAGGEGFTNAAETLTLSPIHAEKYLEAAKDALEYGAKDPRSRAAFLIAEPNDTTTPEQAAKTVLDAFLPRAFRRPVTAEETEPYLALFRQRLKKGENYDSSILFALRGVMISPNFLFRAAEPNPEATPRPVAQYELASRLSYFLWNSMPDKELFDLAAAGKLQEPAVLDAQVTRLLKDQKSREFAVNFVEQWLNTRELGRDIKPDEKLFPEYYNEELQSAMKYEPVLFFQELLAENLPLTNLIDSDWTILTNKLARHYGLVYPKEKISQQPKRFELPENSHRGGLMGMAAVLAVSSYPNRTSPVLRGKWVLDALLGTPPPPPPPNVPELKAEDAAVAATLRERLEQHRKNPVCATCHNRIDPLGFGLENYDVLGRWRDYDADKLIDSTGVLPDGRRFAGPAGMKAVLLQKKDLFFRNLTSKLLGFALNRGLTREDGCVVDDILPRLAQDDYRAQTLIREIVRSVPFRYQPGTKANQPVQPVSNSR